MKTIGILGGMSWESSRTYYELLNRAAREALGGLHSAPLLLWSYDFAEIERLQAAGDWEALGRLLARDAARLEAGGAELLLIATNTMHKVADVVREAVSVPLVHIVDAVGEAARDRGLTRLGLLGTRFTMEAEFFAGRLRERHGLEVLVPDDQGRQYVHEVIYGELCRGEIREASRAGYRRIIGELGERGAGAVVLGCTEIGLLVREQDSPLPLLDTTVLHAEAAARLALS